MGVGISLSEDVELKLWARSKATNTFSVCHWNLNNVSADNYSNVSLIKAYLAVHEFDIICLSETYRLPSQLQDEFEKFSEKL